MQVVAVLSLYALIWISAIAYSKYRYNNFKPWK